MLLAVYRRRPGGVAIKGFIWKLILKEASIVAGSPT
jgi:hypothetical protein